MTDKNTIEVQNLTHGYEGKGTFAVKDVSFAIEQGEIFGFLGPSGAGKSTVQNLLIGLLPLQQGQIRYQGKPVQGLPLQTGPFLMGHDVHVT